VCKQRKLLDEFEFDERLSDRHDNICKESRVPKEMRVSCCNKLGV